MKPNPANKARPSARERGYTSKWERESRAFLARPENRLCACGCGRPAEVVDHIKQHKRDPKLFWSRKNWQALSAHCHNTWKQSEERLGYSTKIGSDGLPIDQRHPFYR